MSPKRFLMGHNVQIYGDVIIGKNCILEDGVVIGHPTYQEIKLFSKDLKKFPNTDDLYRTCTKGKTVIGSDSIIRSGTIIYSGCEIGKQFDCGHNVIVREYTHIGDYTYIKPNTYIMTHVKIGEHCRLAGTVADYTQIGNNVSSFGILTHHRIRRHSDILRNPHKSPTAAHGPILHDNCMVGRGATVVGNITVGANSIIGANVFVNFDVPSGSKIIGVKGIQVS